jgi:hypothetical protein
VGKKSPNQRIERIEQICIGAGFLLKKLRCTYGSDFGVGMTDQVNQCIRDCDHVARNREIREANKSSEVANV